MKGDQTERSHRSAIKCEPQCGRCSGRQTERRSEMKPGLSGTSVFQRSRSRLKRFERRPVDISAPTRVSAGSLEFSTPQVSVTKSDLGGVRSGRGLETPRRFSQTLDALSIGGTMCETLSRSSGG